MIHIFVVMIDALTSKFFCLGHGLQHQCRIRRVEFPIPRPLRSVVRILQVKYSNLLQNIYNIFTIWIKNISNTKTFALGGLDIASEFTSCNESHAHVHLIPTKPLFSLKRSNEILNLVDMMPEIETGQINLTYPITFDPATFQQYNLPAYFGGFQVSLPLSSL